MGLSFIPRPSTEFLGRNLSYLLKFLGNTRLGASHILNENSTLLFFFFLPQVLRVPSFVAKKDLSYPAAAGLDYQKNLIGALELQEAHHNHQHHQQHWVRLFRTFNLNFSSGD